MQIDYFTGKKTTQLYAVKRYADELKKELEKVCDLRVIEVETPVKKGIADIFFFPKKYLEKKKIYCILSPKGMPICLTS